MQSEQFFLFGHPTPFWVSSQILWNIIVFFGSSISHDFSVSWRSRDISYNLYRDVSLNIDRRRGDISHKWILKCFFELPSCEKAFGHWSQEYGFSPECILICVLKFCHLKMILSIDCKGMVYPLNEFSNVSSNFHFIRKLLGIDFMGMVFP